MNDIKEAIGRNIRILRKERGQTLQSLSRQIGITHQQLSRIENGSGTATSTLERIAAILDVDIKILMDEPQETLNRTVAHTRNFVPDQMCNELYAKLYADVIKPVNDITVERFFDEIFEKLVKNKEKIRNLMYSHVGTKESYQFTQAELEVFCQLLFVDFVDHALRLSRTNYEEDKDNGEIDELIDIDE